MHDNCVPLMLVSAGQPWHDCGIKDTRLALSDFEAVMPDEWKNRANRLGLTRQPLLPLRSPEIPVCRSPAPRNCAARQRTRAFWGHSTSSSQVFTIGDDFKYIATSKCLRTAPLFSKPCRTVCLDLSRLIETFSGYCRS
ncbi:hypothetical protein GE21DRAFT_1197662 [Neurospora crassa]|uniref:Uncharacterized protein B24P7.170 n=1 Tax=Neurospora crassa TaxID=5141 RepID=Q9P3R8_NEUCS|nr:hypothetical protein GE21DRAFT_1197662 [Neurospora crassa]CAB97282.2 hypothetical protein [Neurospora crassa]